MAEIFSIGHSNRSFELFVSLLEAWEVALLVDVRHVPRSRRNPQFNGDELARRLPANGIEYRRAPELGGWRRPAADSRNGAWRNESFRGYADYMLTDAFRTALERLVSSAEEQRTAIMCAEALPWRCHRSLIADALLAGGHRVRHITSAAKADEHRMTPFARVDGNVVTYPALL